eukprot:scaffold68570_cov67-Attheya_sp.AAC.2
MELANVHNIKDNMRCADLPPTSTSGRGPGSKLPRHTPQRNGTSYRFIGFTAEQQTTHEIKFIASKRGDMGDPHFLDLSEAPTDFDASRSMMSTKCFVMSPRNSGERWNNSMRTTLGDLHTYYMAHLEVENLRPVGAGLTTPTIVCQIAYLPTFNVTLRVVT